MEQNIELLDLPVVMIENIFSYLTCDEIAKYRILSRTFNQICQHMLNRSFVMIERRHNSALKSVKAQLPRRESERRYHPLARHCDILSSIETRISMLNMTYSKFIDNGMCCFIPGKLSRTFNQICQHMLNRSFVMIERRHNSALKSVKAQLPRRESERRYHPLARHCDILSSIETRISMLNMTYSKFIDNGMCCFIPGKVIDEIRRVLHIVETVKTPPRPHEVLQELRDISSMAIEHFDDKVSPAFRKKMQEGATPPQPRPANANAVFTSLELRTELFHIKKRSMMNTKVAVLLASHFKGVHKRMMYYKRLALKQRKKEQEQDAAIAELKKRIEECDIKYTEVTRTSHAAGGTTMSGCSSEPSGSNRHFSSQIKLDLSVPIGSKRSNKLVPNMKPRKPLIRLPSLSEDEPPTKMARIDDQPSTSKAKPQTTLAKIRGITNEIRHLNQLSKTIEGKLKRPLSTHLDSIERKKMKLD